MVEMDEQTALIADLEHALQSANQRLITLTEELGPWKARALRAEKMVESADLGMLARWLATRGYSIVDQRGQKVPT
jgi:hypothetical protein